jgi:hypothetical protein
VTIKIEQITDAIISAPGSIVQVSDTSTLDRAEAVYYPLGSVSDDTATGQLTLSSVTCTTGRKLIVSVGWDDSESLDDIKWNGIDLTKRAEVRSPTQFQSISVWDLDIQNGGTGDIVADWVGTPVDKALIAGEVTNIISVDQTATNYENSNRSYCDSSTTGTTTEEKEWIYGAHTHDNGDTNNPSWDHANNDTIDGGQVLSNNVLVCDAYENVSALGTYRSYCYGWATSAYYASAILTYTRAGTPFVINSDTWTRFMPESGASDFYLQIPGKYRVDLDFLLLADASQGSGIFSFKVVLNGGIR